jgi:hypothetical protein
MGESVGFIGQIVIPLVAGIGGAMVGGFMSQKASMMAQREAHAQSREDAKARLKHVTGTLLDRIFAASMILGRNDGSREINVSALMEIESTYARFERVGDYVYLLNDPGYGEDLEALLTRVKTMIGQARAVEGEIDFQLKKLNPQPYVNSPDVQHWRAVSSDMRRPVVEAIGRWAEEASRLRAGLGDQ